MTATNGSSDGLVAAAPDVDAIVVGGGFAGLRMLIELRKLGFSVRLLDAGSDVGGAWYWNKYPGARVDSESLYYCYSFSRELEQEWDWSERFPGQPEIQRYLRHVADRFHLWNDITLDTRVVAAQYRRDDATWCVTTHHGTELTARFLITGTGTLTSTYVPDFPGTETFRGETYIPARWPADGVDLTGKRVGIIGTGSSGVQLVPAVAEQSAHLTVFQRTPAYVLPSRNAPLDDERRAQIKADSPAMWAKARRHVYGGPFDSPDRKMSEVTPEERERVLEAGWAAGNAHFLFETFSDIMADSESNERTADFVRRKIRSIVDDPATAEILCPTYPFGAKRAPRGHHYYEAYNRPNVTLVDVGTNPITGVTPTGLDTATKSYDLDVIIYATGFDTVTGALTDMNMRGATGQLLQDKWAAGASAFMGLAVDDFPNLFMIGGPQCGIGNYPSVIEPIVSAIGTLLVRARNDDVVEIEVSAQAVQAWKAENDELFVNSVFNSPAARSYTAGYNIPGKPHTFLFHVGGVAAFTDRVEQMVDEGFTQFSLSRVASSRPAGASIAP